MRKERLAGIITVVMTVAFFISLLWGYGQYQQSRRAFALLENEYQRAYYNYLATVKEMSLSAVKAQNATSLQKAAALSRLNSLAGTAVEQMSVLPVQHTRYQESAAYLNQVGDYAWCLNQKLAQGQTLADEERQNLAAICRQLKDIYAGMAEMETTVADGGIVFANAYQPDSWWQAARQALSGGSRAAQGAMTIFGTADGYFGRANDQITMLNPLVYDGKYSAHMLARPAAGLSGLNRVSIEQALQVAEKFLAQAGWLELTPLSQEEINNTAMPLYAFCFAGQDPAQSTLHMTITQSGGKIVSFFHERQPDPAALPADSAQAVADKLLAHSGFSDMRLIARQALGNELLLKYAYCQEGALCYPDNVEIKVALDNGLVTAFEAREYWMNHHLRTLPATMRSQAEALASLDANAQIRGAKLAFISDSAGGDIACYEIRYTLDGADYLTYIDAERLWEEQVLCCFTADDGSFYTR